MTKRVGLSLIIVSLLGRSCFGLSGLQNQAHSRIENNYYVSGRPQSAIGRRNIVAAGIALMGGWSPHPTASKAAAPIDAGEAIRRSAAKVPGFGQTDVFFPETFSGVWQVTREVEFGGSNRPPLRLTYPFRFVRSIEDGAVVTDRGANQAELEKALVRAVAGQEASGIRSYEWAVSNPNDLRLVFSDGSKKEIKVTKRATERSGATVSSSEFQRVTQEDGSGIPNVSARRVMTKWKIIDESTCEGLEIVYSMAGGDPLSAGNGVSSSPTVLSKSRLYLVR